MRALITTIAAAGLAASLTVATPTEADAHPVAGVVAAWIIGGVIVGGILLLAATHTGPFAPAGARAYVDPDAHCYWTHRWIDGARRHVEVCR